MIQFFSLFNSILSLYFSPDPSVLESTKKKRVFIGTPDTSTVRGIKRNTDPYKDSNDKIILTFIRKKKKKYWIRSIHGRFLCAKRKDPGVVFCKSRNDKNTVWKIKRKKGKLRLKTRGRCLRLVGLDKRKNSYGYYLNVRKCKKWDYAWNIRRLTKTKPKKNVEKKVKKEEKKNIIKKIVKKSVEDEKMKDIIADISDDFDDMGITPVQSQGVNIFGINMIL